MNSPLGDDELPRLILELQNFHAQGLTQAARMALAIARRLERPVELLFVAEVLNDIAKGMRGGPVTVAEVNRIRDGILPTLESVVQGVIANGAAPDEMAILAKRFVELDLHLRMC